VIRYDFRAATNLATAWQQAPQIVAEELTRAMWTAELLLLRGVQEATPVGATGLLRQSISAREPQRLGNQVIGEVGTSIAHAAPVEIGTRPHFPPIAPLQDWVERKLGVTDEHEARGTKGAAMFSTVFTREQGRMASIFEAAERRIAERLAKPRGSA
jgi:hypothetical protein